MKKLVGIIAVLVALLLIVPFLIPTETYLRQIERVASEKLNQPVSIKTLHFALLPSPRANIGDLRIGKNDEVRVGNVAAIAELGSLFSETRVITVIEASDPVIQKGALDFVAALPKTEASSVPAKVLIRRLRLNKLQLMWPGIDIPVLNVEATLTQGNLLQTLKLASSDGHLRADLTPQGEGYSIKIDATQWTFPVGPKVLFNRLKSEMTLHGSKLHVASLEGGLYQGALDANADLDWSKGLHGTGKFNVNNIAIAELEQLFNRQKLVSGRLNANGTFGVNTKEASTAADHLVLDSIFNVTNGVLHGVDLAKAATLLLKTGVKGGETDFDELSGALHMSGKQIELKNLQISSGLLAASGGVKVSPARQLDGVIDVKLKKGVILVAIPLRVSGTLDAPVVFPTKAALAGAALGTGVLGPGVGTSVGLKAAAGVEKLKGLFGGDKNQR